METSIKITLIVVAAIFLLAVIGVAIYYNSNVGATVNVQGISQIKAVPDLVTVYFSIETNASTAQEAKDENALIVDNIITALVKQGFERKDITTENFNIYPYSEWQNNKYVEKGYKTTHNLKVQLSTSQTDKIGEVIDAGVDNGALISYINFELSVDKQNQYKAEALTQATQDAKIKADSIAAGLGKSVGKLVSISSSNFDYYPWPIYRNDVMTAGGAEAKTATTSIQPGQQDINAQVLVVYQIR